MNVVTLMGNLGKDPEYREGSVNVCKFTLAVTDGYGDKKRTDWIPVVCFNKIADNCAKYLTKGSKVYVVGKIQTGSYEKDGRTVYTTDVIASQVGFISSKGNSSSERENPTTDENRGSQGYSQLSYDDFPF